jgi:hypothetical protein
LPTREWETGRRRVRLNVRSRGRKTTIGHSVGTILNWRGRYDVVKEWRQRNPGYQRNWRLRKKQQRIQMKPGEIQAELFTKALDTVEKNVILLREIQAEIKQKAIMDQ